LLKEGAPAQDARFGTAVALANFVASPGEARLFVSRVGGNRTVYVQRSLDEGETWQSAATFANVNSPGFGDNLSASSLDVPAPQSFSGRRFASGTRLYTLSGTTWSPAFFD